MLVPIDRAGLAPEELARLTALVADHGTLGRVVRAWAAAQPPRLIAEIVTQDEYTHDVIIPYQGALHLVYDTT